MAFLPKEKLVAQHLMGLDLGSKKAVSTCRPWQHRMTAGFGYDLDTIKVWRFFGEATCEAMAKVGARPQDVLAISTTGMRHGSVVVDARGEVLLATPTRDGRGALQGLQLAGERGREFHERTGHFPAPLFTASRLLWMADSAPELLGRAHAVLGLSDWLAYWLSGKMVAEPSVASESGLFEVSARRWADDLIRSLGLPRHLFPEVVSSGTALGPLGKDAAAHLGLQPGIQSSRVAAMRSVVCLARTPLTRARWVLSPVRRCQCSGCSIAGSLMMRRACGRHTMSFRVAGRLSPMVG